MRRIATLSVALLVLGASTCMAQGLDLYFNECLAGGGSLCTPALNCGVNTGLPLDMVCSVIAFAPMTKFAAATAIVDISVGAYGSALPLWWQTSAGQCRARAIAMSFDPASNPGGCVDVWLGLPNLQVTAIQQGLHGTNTIRVNGVAAVPVGSEIPLAAGDELWVCRVRITKPGTTTCAGCAAPATIVFTECKLQSPTEPNQVISNTADNISLTIGVAQPYCSTPAQNKTWGAVKNLYR
jgi:hypothetical protein